MLGNENLLKESSIAIVGSRDSTEYGEQVTKYFTKELVLRDVVIVSGAARGIDYYSHKTCLENSGKTIAVLGIGFDHISKKKNKEILQSILDKDGLIVSEYLPEQGYRKENYMQRNRIISGLAEAVIIIECSIKSGTRITGNYALKQKKKLFAVPNNIFEEKSEGANYFIKKGAFLLDSIEDILDKIPEIPKERKVVETKEFNVKEIYNLIEKGFSEKESIANKLKVEIKFLTDILFEMELNGQIEYKVGKGYIALGKERMID